VRVKRTLRVDRFTGVNVNTPPELLGGEQFPVDENGDRRPGYSWRVRRGFKRLMDDAAVGVQSAGVSGNLPKRLIEFERDDSTMFMVFVGGLSAWTNGQVDDVQAVTPGDPE